MNEIRFAMCELINIRINYKFLVNSWCMSDINFRQLGESCPYSIIIIIILINRRNKILLSFFLYKNTKLENFNSRIIINCSSNNISKIYIWYMTFNIKIHAIKN